MEYREDPDLKFLRGVSSNDLDALVTYVTRGSDGGKRFAEQLTSREEYKKYYPKHKKYWNLIAAEVQLFGANTFVSFFRGGMGVPYAEILTDVCDKMGVEYGSQYSVEKKEMCLLLRFLDPVIQKMSQEKRQQFLVENDIKANSSSYEDVYNAVADELLKPSRSSYLISALVSALLAKGIYGNAIGAVTDVDIFHYILDFIDKASNYGHIGAVISVARCAFDISSPAYRVTIPSVIHIAYLRRKYKYRSHRIKMFFIRIFLIGAVLYGCYKAIQAIF